MMNMTHKEQDYALPFLGLGVVRECVLSGQFVWFCEQFSALSPDEGRNTPYEMSSKLALFEVIHRKEILLAMW